MKSKYVDEIRRIKQDVIDLTYCYIKSSSDKSNFDECIPIILKQLDKMIGLSSEKPKRRAYTLLDISNMEENIYENENN